MGSSRGWGVNVRFTKGGYSKQERAKKPMRSSVLALSILLVFCVGAQAAANAPARQQAAPEHRITQSESYTMLAPMYATIMDG